MAHFAHVVDGFVTRPPHVVVNAVIENGDGIEVEALGQSFLADLWGGDPAEYVQCSYNGNMRGCYPGVGYTWDGIDFAPPPEPEPPVIVDPEPIEPAAP